MKQLSIFDLQPKKRTSEKILEAICSMDNSLGSRVGSIFRHMEIAEEEIASAMSRFPDIASAINDKCFMLCFTPTIMTDKGDIVYRAFCREIIERFALGRSTDEATDAEMLCLILEATWKSPLTHNASSAAYILFSKIFDTTITEKIIRENDGPILTEEYRGAAQEIIDVGKRKYRRYL
jgi:hypothetical protein